MRNSYPDGFIPIDGAFDQACSALIECDSTSQPEVIFSIKAWRTNDQQQLVDGFSPALFDYDLAIWRIEKEMRSAIIEGALSVYVQRNGNYEVLVIDPKEWAWQDVYGHTDPDRPPGPIGGITGTDSQGRLRLLKLADFQQWSFAKYGIRDDRSPTDQVAKGGGAEALPPPQNHVSERVKGRRGPKAGTVRRYEEADRALFPELEKRMATGLTRSAAANDLAREGSVKGNGTPESREKRLASLHSRDRAKTR